MMLPTSAIGATMISSPGLGLTARTATCSAAVRDVVVMAYRTPTRSRQSLSNWGTFCPS